MIINGSIEISSKVRIYKPDTLLCCKQQEEKLLKDYLKLKHIIENSEYIKEDFNSTDENLFNSSDLKLDDYHMKRYECYEMNGKIRFT